MSQDVLGVLLGSEPTRAGLRDRVLLLRSVENFVGLDEEALTLLAEHARHRQYKKGDVIVTEGLKPESIHIVVEGQVTLSRKKTPMIMKVGGGFGVLSIISGSLTRRAVADMDTRTLEIPAAAFQIALEENFSLLRNALRMMGHTLLRARSSLPAEEPPEVSVGDYFEKPKTLAERLVQLRSGPFASMNVDALVDLARCMVECRVPAGEELWSVGDASTHVLHIDYGRVRCTAADGSHMDIGSNFTLGAMNVWAGEPRAYAARTETDVIGYRVKAEDFFIILEMHVQVGLELLRGLARGMVEND